jgi:hypothetical protein
MDGAPFAQWLVLHKFRLSASIRFMCIRALQQTTVGIVVI